MSWRLLMEPRRLWRRYLVEDTRFLVLFARQWAATHLGAVRPRPGERRPLDPRTARTTAMGPLAEGNSPRPWVALAGEERRALSPDQGRDAA